MLFKGTEKVSPFSNFIFEFPVTLFQLPSFSETANIQTGSSQRLSITLSNTMGVSTSANVGASLKAFTVTVNDCEAKKSTSVNVAVK